jgi:hypothetical protein
MLAIKNVGDVDREELRLKMPERIGSGHAEYPRTGRKTAFWRDRVRVAAVFLASDDASFVTGTSFVVEAG